MDANFPVDLDWAYIRQYVRSRLMYNRQGYHRMQCLTFSMPWISQGTELDLFGPFRVFSRARIERACGKWIWCEFKDQFGGNREQALIGCSVLYSFV